MYVFEGDLGNYGRFINLSPLIYLSSPQRIRDIFIISTYRNDPKTIRDIQCVELRLRNYVWIE